MITRKFQTSELQEMNLLTIQEVAQCAKVSTKTIYRWISDKKIPAVHIVFQKKLSLSTYDKMAMITCFSRGLHPLNGSTFINSK